LSNRDNKENEYRTCTFSVKLMKTVMLDNIMEVWDEQTDVNSHCRLCPDISHKP